jgi:hypothetical protein
MAAVLSDSGKFWPAGCPSERRFPSPCRACRNPQLSGRIIGQRGAFDNMNERPLPLGRDPLEANSEKSKHTHRARGEAGLAMEQADVDGPAQYMAFHGFYNLLAAGALGEFELLIEGVQLKGVMMRQARWRTRALIGGSPHHVTSLLGAIRKRCVRWNALRQRRAVARNIKDDPMWDVVDGLADMGITVVKD